jgi:hypothetical protein
MARGLQMLATSVVPQTLHEYAGKKNLTFEASCHQLANAIPVVSLPRSIMYSEVSGLLEPAQHVEGIEGGAEHLELRRDHRATTRPNGIASHPKTQSDCDIKFCRIRLAFVTHVTASLS